MLLTNNHFTVVVGIDIHFTTLPPFNPFHPYIGLVIDPADYIPYLGTDVHINGIKRGNSDTGGMLITLQHIRLFSPWVMEAIIGHESMNFFASETVYSDSTRLSPKGHMLMTCNDIGIPLSLSVGKSSKPKRKFKLIPTFFAPTSFSLPIPTGLPVNVGGPYSPDWGGMLTGLLMSMGFSSLLRGLRGLVKKLNLSGKFPSGLKKTLCRFGFEPINLVNGAVIYEGEDFTLPSPLALEWERSWYSDSSYSGWLGHGVHSNYDRAVEIYPLENAVGLRMSDGRLVAFEALSPNESYYNRSEKVTLSLSSDGNSYTAYHHEEQLYYEFTDYQATADKYQLTRITNSNGLSIVFSFTNHQLVSITDVAGREIAVRHNSAGFITSLTLLSPTGLEEPLVSYEYDDLGNMTAIIDALGEATHMVYEDHLMVSKTDRNGQCFYWEYDAEDRCVHTWGDGGWQEGTIAYHPSLGYNLVTDANGAVTTYYYTPEQLVTRIQDPLGNSTHYSYTEHMELHREIDAEGRITGYSYDERGNKISVRYPDNTQELFVYDEKDRLTIAVDPEGEQTLYVYEKEHPAQLRSIVEPDKTLTHFTYHENGLLATVSKKENKVALGYDESYNLSSWHENGELVKRWSYNHRGKVTMEHVPNQLPNHFFYDVLGRLEKITQNTGGNIYFGYNKYDEVTKVADGSREVSFSYTPMGSLAMREQNGVKVHFSYDKMEQLQSITNEGGESYEFYRNKAGYIIKERAFDGIVKNYKRNQAGEVTRIERTGGGYTEYEQDALGRITRADYHDGTWETYSYNKNGLLIEATNAQVQIIFERDAKGRIVKETQKQHLDSEENGITVVSTYNALGQRIHVESSLGAMVDTAYDSQGNIAEISAASEALKAQHKNWEAKLTYDNIGRELERFATGGVHVKNTYDNNGKQLGQSIYSNKKQTGFRSYHWNTNQQLQSISSHLSQEPTFFNYDAFGNLAQATYSQAESLFKTPDAIGNLYKTADQSDRVYGKGGKLIKDESYYYKYDEDGNLLLKSKRNINEPLPTPESSNLLDKWFQAEAPSKKAQAAHQEWQQGDWAYRWQANGMLASVQKPDGSLVSFEYDALGRRTAKIVGGTINRYLWDGNVLLHEWSYKENERPSMVVDELGLVSYNKPEPTENVTTWIYEDNKYVPCAKIVNDSTYSIISDRMGTPIQAYDSDGNKVWDCELDIYGKVRTIVGDKTFIPFRYQGQYEDVETGLYYNRFRYYSPDTGCYISQDPIGLAGGMPNMYAYVHDSNEWVDPLGLNEIYTGMVFRGMSTNSNGSPVIYSGPTENGMNAAKSLGIRPGEAGMSTGIDPYELQPHRKPPEFGGTFKKGTMFEIDTKVLDKYGLEAIKDGDNHVSIKTKKGVNPDGLGDRLAKTQGDWKKACH